MENKDQFKNWVLNNLTKNSGAGPSYVKSIDWLSDRLNEKGMISEESIFDIEDIERITVLHTEVKKIQRDKNSFIYNENAPSYGKRYFYSASLNKYKEFLLGKNKNSTLINTLEESGNKSEKFRINSLRESIHKSGLIYSQKIVTRFVASLLTKPFVILTGLSGSGKTKLAQAFVEWICQDEEQYCIIPVGADWTNREPLLGYPNALEPDKYVKPDSGVLDLIIRANSSPDLPYFLILDEMNLSHVERYFADFLSVMESDKEIPLYSGNTVGNGVEQKLKLPKNLFIIGTVNIDETTNMFSPKVLDRANTIEFRVSVEEMSLFLEKVKEINMKVLKAQGAGMARSFLQLSKNKSFTNEGLDTINKTLLLFFKELSKTGAEFGYRSASEILQLINQLSKFDDKLSPEEKIDIAIMQKLLPKLHGSRGKLHDTLVTLGLFCLKEKEKVKIENDIFNNHDFNFNSTSVRYPLSLEKIARMYKGAIVNGFTSFAEA